MHCAKGNELPAQGKFPSVAACHRTGKTHTQTDPAEQFRLERIGDFDYAHIEPGVRFLNARIREVLNFHGDFDMIAE